MERWLRWGMFARNPSVLARSVAWSWTYPLQLVELLNNEIISGSLRVEFHKTIPVLLEELSSGRLFHSVA